MPKDTVLAKPVPAMNLTRRKLVLTTAASVALPMGHVCAQTANPASTAPAITSAFDGIHYLRGLVRVNGERITSDKAPIRPGDTVMTGSDGQLWVAIGADAIFLRQRTELVIQPSASSNAVVGTLRLITGAVGAVFGKRSSENVRITTATATIGIRGTGTYMETRGEGLYFCTCHGQVHLAHARSSESTVVTATRHAPRLCLNEPVNGQWIVDAPFETHTDDEMDGLEKCVGRRAPWNR